MHKRHENHRGHGLKAVALDNMALPVTRHLRRDSALGWTGSGGDVGPGSSRRAMGPARRAGPFENSERRNRPVPVEAHCRTLISTGWLERARTANLYGVGTSFSPLIHASTGSTYGFSE